MRGHSSRCLLLMSVEMAVKGEYGTRKDGASQETLGLAKIQRMQKKGNRVGKGKTRRSGSELVIGEVKKEQGWPNQAAVRNFVGLVYLQRWR